MVRLKFRKLAVGNEYSSTREYFVWDPRPHFDYEVAPPRALRCLFAVGYYVIIDYCSIDIGISRFVKIIQKALLYYR